MQNQNLVMEVKVVKATKSKKLTQTKFLQKNMKKLKINSLKLFLWKRLRKL